VAQPKAIQGLLNFLSSKSSTAAAKAALPGAGLNALAGLVTGGPVDALAYGLGDFAVNYPVIRGARRIFPGKKVEIKNLETGEITKDYQPSFGENAANLGASLGSNYLISSLMPPRVPAVQPDAQQFLAQQTQQVIPKIESQPVQNAQQMIQRSQVNQLPLSQSNVSPNTMYQMQGIEQTAFHYPGLTLPPELLEQLQQEGLS
jgi:hypothetical protein